MSLIYELDYSTTEPYIKLTCASIKCSEASEEKPGTHRVPVFVTRCQILYPEYYALSLEERTSIQSPCYCH